MDTLQWRPRLGEDRAHSKAVFDQLHLKLSLSHLILTMILWCSAAGRRQHCSQEVVLLFCLHLAVREKANANKPLEEDEALPMIRQLQRYSCDFLKRCCCLVTKLCLTLCDPVDCSPPGFSVQRIFQAGILEWTAISFSRRSSRPRG